MFKLYSKGCEYTLRALVHLPHNKSDEKYSPTAICRKAKTPKPYTQKAFQILAKKGILHSSTGPRGGYYLAKHPKNISLLSIIEAIDGEESFGRCVLGLSACDNDNPCPIHNTWKKMKAKIVSELESKSLEDLMKKISRENKKE